MMRKKHFLLSILLSIPAISFSQVTLGQVDDFQDFTTRNWTKNNTIPNANIFDGGPLGAGDNFLRVSSNGSGSNLNLMTFNNAQWTGSFTSAGITYISMDVRNSGSEIIYLRLSFRYSVSSTQQEVWSTTNPIAVIPGAGWKKISFPINQASVVRVSGLNPYSTTFSHVQEMRILHNDAPSWDSDPITATLDIDNIRATNQALGVSSVKLTENNFKIAPNPTSDYLQVLGLTKKSGFKVYNASGNLVKEGIINNNTEKINIQDLTSGIYFIKLDSGESSFKFVKK
ncbi:T9SS type A sorting domain-containing protein [Chryseobacterium sp. Marseille-Q8038]